MRSDFDKVITERPRSGGGIKTPKGERKRFQRTPLDEQPKREKIQAKWQLTMCEKEFSDLIGPLRRYVHSVIGRKFDDVYSEIKKTLRGGGLMMEHLLGHLWYMLERRVVINAKGEPCYSEVSRFLFHHRGEAEYLPIRKYLGVEAYVDPRDGVIKEAPGPVVRHFSWEKPEPKVKWLDDIRCAGQINGVWYEFTTRPCTKEEVAYNNRFYSTAQHVIRYYGRLVVLLAKRQLNRQEIKRLELRKTT